MHTQSSRLLAVPQTPTTHQPLSRATSTMCSQKIPNKISSNKLAILPIAIPIAPHTLFFGIYNALYYLPILLVFLWGYQEGGVESFVSFSTTTMVAITCIYFVGFFSFICGAKMTTALKALGPTHGIHYKRRPWIDIRLSDKFVIFLMVLCFLASKIAIIPLGVYSTYAFDSGKMTGGVWTFSTFCSEALLLISILVLFSSYKRRVPLFIFLSLINCVNLLHGTRIFFISTVLAAIIYAYVIGHLSIRRMLIVGPITFTLLLGLTYVVFLLRSSVSLEGGLTAERLLSPLVYESVFSQISLVGAANAPKVWGTLYSGLYFISDALINSMPRLLLPDKDALLYIDKYAYLSPLGGFNGYAQGLIYFGLFFPVFYFIVGFFASFLYQKAKSSGWWLVIYIYFTADFLFRIMRDGYLIPIKGMINCLEILCILVVLRKLFRMRPDLSTH